jgi:rare lipoprotein A
VKRRLTPTERWRTRRVAVATVLVLSTAAINQGQRTPAATAAASEEVAKQRSKKSSTRLSVERHALSGVASRCADHFQGRRTANGERFDQRSHTAAHKTLPFGTYLKVTNRRNKRSVTVRINDRGPHVKGRVLDLSEVAARAIGFHYAGLTQVGAVVVESPS